ncbi:hypothetical protein DESC_850013 [Desulfosarcina cetonica]|nr:hypothetical protein DESC_850013 [Desulfosarcina cetonica]
MKTDGIGDDVLFFVGAVSGSQTGIAVVLIQVGGHVIQVVGCRHAGGIPGIAILVIITDGVAIDIGLVGKVGVIVGGRCAVGHQDDVVLLTAVLHGTGIGVGIGQDVIGIVLVIAVEPALHACEIKPGFGQGFGQWGAAIGGQASHRVDQLLPVGVVVGYAVDGFDDTAAIFIAVAVIVIEPHQAEADIFRILNDIGDHRLGHGDSRAQCSVAGGIIVEIVAQIEVFFRSTAGAAAGQCRLGRIPVTFQFFLDGRAGDVGDIRHQNRIGGAAPAVPALLVDRIGNVGPRVDRVPAVIFRRDVLGGHTAGCIEDDQDIGFDVRALGAIDFGVVGMEGQCQGKQANDQRRGSG